MSDASPASHIADSAPLAPDRLQAAVDAGILTEHQADRLVEFWAAGEAASADVSALDVSYADREEVRFVRGFHDIFISIGLVILMLGLFYGLQDVVPAWGIAGVCAAATWALAEVFARRMRLALPSFLLSVAFTPFFFAACFGLVVHQDLTLADPGRWLHEHEGLFVIPMILVVIAGSVLFYRRFKVPVGIASITAGCLFLGAVIVETVVPGLIASWNSLFFLVLGLLTFALAMVFDARDPGRVTLNSDKAFWLHLMAAPLIVHSVLDLMSGVAGAETSAYYTAVIVLFLVLAVIALVVDRRALLVSALSYLGFAIGYLIAETSVSSEATFAVTLVVLGAVILFVGSGWHQLRRLLLRPLAGSPLLAYVPAPN
ncbi:hypothetical protein [Roseibium aestuarii]|uniref:DUF2157 domain-containing protein n=1 Tax=Roseibium aestuarii TaxID=2600299 RepID=A0ABW4JZ26_9HYPH|nr:hypothetical protein [Roseibium aestuarii]